MPAISTILVKRCPFSTNRGFGSRPDPSSIGSSYDDPNEESEVAKKNVPCSRDVSISLVSTRRVLEDPNLLCKDPH